MKNIFALWIKRHLKKNASAINRASVERAIHREVDISAGYFLLVIVANLIALSGLIMNSAPVIIGAMLISPLMSPILNIGFAFVTGNTSVWRLSLKKIASGVAVTVAVAALATLLSPLKDLTSEIVARTRPNLYDLVIAFLAGIVGASALCTKRNYLTVVPGVAIATAVIPPLSVTGFGLGVGDLQVAGGGFLLFFTNLVAIIIATGMVFFYYGFRPVVSLKEGTMELRKRITYLATVLIVISIPLVYTLKVTIAEVKLRSGIQSALKDTFNREGVSRLSSFDYKEQGGHGIDIRVTVNTVSYLKESEINNAEKKIARSLNSPVDIHVEQVKVHPGGLKAEKGNTPVPSLMPPKDPGDAIVSIRRDVIPVVRKAVDRLGEIIAPSFIDDFQVGFGDRSPELFLLLKTRRDSPLTEQEIRRMERLFSSELRVPVRLIVERAPVIPLLVFKRGSAELSDEMKKSLAPVEEVYRRGKEITVIIDAYPEMSISMDKRKELLLKRTAAVVSILTGQYKIPIEKVKKALHLRKANKEGRIRVSVHAMHEEAKETVFPAAY